MKLLHFLSLFLFFTISSQQAEEYHNHPQDLIKINHDHDHHRETVMSYLSLRHLTPVPTTRSKDVNPGYTRLDLTRFNGRKPVRLTARFPSSRAFRFLPRRCHHVNQLFDQLNRPVEIMDPDTVRFTFKKFDPLEIEKVHHTKNEILSHRHVARVDDQVGPPAGMVSRWAHLDVNLIPRSHHHDHEGWKAVLKRVKEGKHHHDHRHGKESDHKVGDKKENHDHDHHDHDDHYLEGNEVVNKIRKFLGFL